MFVKRKLLNLFLLLILLYYTSPVNVNASVLFFDDFSNQAVSYNNWEKKNTFGHPENSQYPIWSVIDGFFKAITNDVNYQNNQYLIKTWDYNETNYRITYDFTKIMGADVNMIFNYHLNDCFYEVHFSGSNVDISKCGFPWINGQPVYLTSYPLVNGTTYNVKIELLDNNIKIYIKKSSDATYIILFDINDSGTKWSGRTGLRAGTGSVNDLEIWFDNFKVESLGWEPTGSPTETPTPTPSPTSTPTPTPTNTPTPTVTPTPTNTPTPTPTSTPTSTPTPTPTNTPTPTPTSAPNNPLILVPGLGGSISVKGMLLDDPNANDWSLTPGTGVYDNLINFYKNDPNFYVFFYDWRKPIKESANDLYNFILAKVPSGSKADIIGHSLGGLVARSCMQEKPDGCLVNKLVTVGSPHYGAIDTYPLLEGGEIWRDGVSRLAMEILITYHQQIGETRKDTITRIAPVLKDLLPTFDYLKMNGSTKSYTSLSLLNQYLPWLNADYSALNNKATTVFGENINTVSELKLGQRSRLDSLLNLWPDGKVISKNYTQQGDQTVLVTSATVNQTGIDTIGFNLNHGQLISDTNSVKAILDKLGKATPLTSFPAVTESTSYLVFMVHSPVALELEGTPSASFASDHLIIVANPTAAVYQVKLNGTGDGQFRLDVGQIAGNNANWWKYEDVAKTDVSDTWKFKFNSITNPSDPLVDQHNLLNKKQSANQIQEFIALINQSSLTKVEKALLIRQLNALNTKELVFLSIGKINLLGLGIVSFFNKNRISQATFSDWYDRVQGLYDLTLMRIINDPRPVFTVLAMITNNVASYNLYKAENNPKLTVNGAKVLLYAKGRIGPSISFNTNPKYRFYQSRIVLDTLKHGEMVRR